MPHNCLVVAGPGGCKVELSQRGGSLDVDGAQLTSGGRGTSSLGEELWALVAWARAEATWCRLRRKKTEQGSHPPPALPLHLPRNTQTYRLAGPS